MATTNGPTTNGAATTATLTAAPVTTSSARLISLDALRGFTIAAMIVVNYPGSEDHVFFTLRTAGISPELASLVYALLFVIINFIPAWWLYRKKIFIRL